MSIASEEAVELWPEPMGPEGRIRAWAHENHLLRAGYEHGRTAESTEAEVRAAAIQQYFIELPLHGATATLEQAEYDFNATISSNERRTRMMNARSVLAAVRSVVMA
jgi:hypothetical protein